MTYHPILTTSYCPSPSGLFVAVAGTSSPNLCLTFSKDTPLKHFLHKLVVLMGTHLWVLSSPPRDAMLHGLAGSLSFTR